MTLVRLALPASALCLGLLLACGGTTENSHDDDPTDGGGGNNGGSGGDSSNGGSGGVGGNGGNPGDCPTLEPAGGSSCPLVDQVCSYANCTAPDYRDGHVLQCVEGAWLLVAEQTCTAPEECPPYVYVGGYCSPTMSQGPCPYYDSCGALRDVYCIDNVWQFSQEGEDAAPPDGGGGTGAGGTALSSATVTTSPEPVPACPVYAPYQGTPCCPNDYPEYCDYSESGSDSSVATQTGFGATGGATGPATGGGALPPLTCAVCTSQMIWDACPEQ